MPKNDIANKILFLLLLITAVCLRLVFLSGGQILGDEPAYLLRSVGWIDTLFTPEQKTPTDVLQYVPTWTKLSFHDHPPLTFAINHVFLTLFGNNLFAGRLSSALFGIGSVILVYFIGKTLCNSKKSGLLAMGLFAINDFVVFYSRTAMMESIVVFFILLTMALFIRAQDNPKYLPIFGVSLGLAVLSKYTSVAIIPLYIMLIVFHKKEYLKNCQLYLGIILFTITLTPIIIYNYQMYNHFGHFDLQISHIFNQNTPEWTNIVGKMQAGNINNRLVNWKNFVQSVSPPFLIIAILSIVHFTYIAKKTAAHFKTTRLVIGGLICFSLGTLIWGSETRFIYYIMPYLCIIIGAEIAMWLNQLPTQSRKIWIITFTSVFFIYELLFSINTNVLANKINIPNNDWIIEKSISPFYDGTQILDAYLESELQNFTPKHVNTFENTNINLISQKFIEKHGRKKSQQPIHIVYDPNISTQTYYWAILKRRIYEGWPATSANQFDGLLGQLHEQDQNATIYYIRSISEEKNQQVFKDRFKELKIFPTTLYHKQKPKFEIYKFNVTNKETRD